MTLMSSKKKNVPAGAGRSPQLLAGCVFYFYFYPTPVHGTARRFRAHPESPIPSLLVRQPSSRQAGRQQAGTQIQSRYVKLARLAHHQSPTRARVPHSAAGAADGGGQGASGRLGGAAAAGAGGGRELRRCGRRGHVGADAGERGGLHRGHRRARPPLRLPRRRVGRGLPRRRRRRLRHALLHVATRQDKLEEEETEECCHVHYTYGDLGDRCFGTIGRCLTEILVLVSQAGGSVAYLIFIGQNLHSTFSQLMSPAGFIFAILLPLQIALSFIRSLSSLSPFSIFADVCNVLAMAIVIKEDLQLFDHPFSNRSAFNGLWAVPFTFGVAVFCFEGFSMTLALEASMAERRKFRWVLSQAVAAIITVYVCFGVCGYLAYGEATKDIITLNLPNNWSSAAVKVGLCIALAFTFPVMMHPIHEIVETRFRSNGCFQKLCHNIGGAEWIGLHSSRVLVVATLTVVASFIPAFGSFISFVGSTMCALLSFVLPALFHLRIVGSSIPLWKQLLDYAILLFGLAFAGYGLVSALSPH